MSIQEEEKKIYAIKHDKLKKEQHKTNLSPLDVYRHNYNVYSYSKDISGKIKIVPRNFKNSVNYQQIIKTMIEIKHNFMKNIRIFSIPIIQSFLNVKMI